MSSFPEPLVPAYVDLRDFAGMWIDTERLLRSDTWQLGTGDQKAAALTLWLESWHQVPAASLPANDKLLAKLSQADAWPKAREHALRGWIECTDGRLYHPVVAEKALEAWVEKLAAAISGAEGNAKRWQVEIDSTTMREQFTKAVRMLRAIAPQSRVLRKKAVLVISSASPADRNPTNSTEQELSPPDRPPTRTPNSPRSIRTEPEISTPNRYRTDQNRTDLTRPELSSPLRSEDLRPTAVSDAVIPAPAPQADLPADAESKPRRGRPPKTALTHGAAAFEAYAAAYLRRYGVSPVRNAKVNAQCAQLGARLGAEAPDVAAFFVGQQRMDYVRAVHPIDLLLRDAEGLRTAWATGRSVTHAAAVQADRTETNRSAFAPIIAEARAREEAEGRAIDAA